MTWTSDRIRDTFLQYFSDNGHRRMSSMPLVPPDDPTLLFVNAGMVQFKDVFTGQRQVDYGAACTSQKCLRVSGKHNDLENVGRTARHHTFFEMLGNFSFGDYFKEKAIRMAWELVTKVYGLDPAKLWVTVYPDDQEARDLWLSISSLPAERIVDDAENFWSMGDTGACGPCSEIYYDQGSALSGGVEIPFGDEGDRYLEFYNVVFMQYDRAADGTLTPLPKPCIDTGMGLERITALLQGKQSNYSTDAFSPLIERTASMAGVKYGQDPEQDVALQVIADHARATTFLIADGIYPENEGRGYVIRRVMRRAMRFGRKLGFTGPFLRDVCAQVVETMHGAYPELRERAEVIQTMVTQEEERFGRTLVAGLRLLEDAMESHKDTRQIPGKIAFELYDTHGFPLDLTEQAAGEKEFSVDTDGFEKAMENQRAMGRASWKGSTSIDTTHWESVRDDHGAVEFVGYENETAEAQILSIQSSGDDTTLIVTSTTPFYAESGGQVGDSGSIVTNAARFDVTDTQAIIDGITVHHGSFSSGSFTVGEAVTLQVDSQQRTQTRRNHSATHLLHFALRHVLGDHVKQRGSLVGPNRLRFDFSHFGPLTDEEATTIEDMVNARIVQNEAVTTDVLSKDEAIAKGAVAFFGDKYGDEVRMLTITSDSVELCGGTHVQSTGDIGLFKIVSDSALAAGVRRLEAATGLHALHHVQNQEATLRTLANELKVGVGEVTERVLKLKDDNASMRATVQNLQAKERAKGVSAAAPKDINGTSVLIMSVSNVKGGDLRDMSDKARQRLGSGVVLIASNNQPKVALLVAVTDDLTDRFAAGKLIGELAPIVGGRGGGRPDLAQAGGSEPDQIPSLIAAFESIIANG